MDLMGVLDFTNTRTKKLVKCWAAVSQVRYRSGEDLGLDMHTDDSDGLCCGDRGLPKSYRFIQGNAVFDS